MKRAIAFLLLPCLALLACGEGEGEAVSEEGYEQDSSVVVSNESQSGRPGRVGQQVLIVDRGMNMPIGMMTVPDGWQVFQDIATNTQTATYDRFVIDIQSPDGMLIRALGTAFYHHAGGSDFDSLVEQIALSGTQGIERLTYGTFEPNHRVMARPQFQQAMQEAQAQGMQLQAVHLPFSGSIDGRPVEGRLEVGHTLFLDQGQHTGGMVGVKLLISAPQQLASLVRVADAIDLGFQANPSYDRARAQVIGTASRQRMARSQAQFESHQRMMQGRYDSAYAQNDRWLQNFRSSGGSGGAGGGYSGHDKFIDLIEETTSFDDPGTGQRTRQDGMYERWATDGQGNYVGSDDPSFDPNALDGNWQEARPLD